MNVEENKYFVTSGFKTVDITKLSREEAIDALSRTLQVIQQISIDSFTIQNTLKNYREGRPIV